MKTKPSQYTAHVQFEAVAVTVTAKNKVEAIKKIRRKIAEINPARMIDKQNFFVDRDE